MCFVDPKSEVTFENFVKPILTSKKKTDVPRLYGSYATKVVLNMDSATSHTAGNTHKWLDESKIKYISREIWLPYSPDLSPLGYFANSYLKTQLKHRQYSIIDGLKRCAAEKWGKIPREMLQNGIDSWESRVSHVFRSGGRPLVQS